MQMPPSELDTERSFHGMDYGVPPRFMLMGNLALGELWQKANRCALGYLRLPRYESLFDVPAVAIAFKDAEKGAEFFDLLKSWDCEPGSGGGTDISFIEDPDSTSYTLTIGPNYDEMIKRLLHPRGKAAKLRGEFISQVFGTRTRGGKDTEIRDNEPVEDLFE